MYESDERRLRTPGMVIGPASHWLVSPFSLGKCRLQCQRAVVPHTSTAYHVHCLNVQVGCGYVVKVGVVVVAHAVVALERNQEGIFKGFQSLMAVRRASAPLQTPG